MTKPAGSHSVRTELALRIEYPGEPGRLARILKSLGARAGALRAQLTCRLPTGSLLLVLCEKPEEAAQALLGEGERAELETVVTVRTRNVPDAFRHLVKTLEADGLEILYACAAALDDDLLAVFRTARNSRAEDVLRSFLLLPDPSIPTGPWADPSPGGARTGHKGEEPGDQPTKRSS